MINSSNMCNAKHQKPVTIHIKLADFLTRLAPEAEFDVQTHSNPTVEEILIILCARCGETFRKAIVDSKGILHGGMVVVVNNRLVPPNRIAKTRLDHQSKMSIIPLAGGG